MLYLFTASHYIHYTMFNLENVSSFSRHFLIIFYAYSSNFSHYFPYPKPYALAK